jgi:uncharacterized protein (TIGR02099 family)
MHNSLIKIIKLSARWLGVGAVLLTVGMVILIFVGRQTIGSLDQLRPNLQSLITSNIGMEVNLGELQGEWPELIPIIVIAGIEILDANADSIFSLKKGRADLDLFNTIKLGAPIWRELLIEKLDISFVEDANGYWHLKGFSGQSDSDLDIIIQPFLFSRIIRLKSVSVNLHTFSGATMQIFGDEIRIENDADFHRAQLSLSLTEGSKSAQVIFEAYGDPADVESFYANGHIKFEQLNLSQPLLALTKTLLPEFSYNVGKGAVEIGGEIWMDVHPGGGLDYEGNLSVSTIPLPWLADFAPISNLNTGLIGWFTPGKDWGAQLQDLRFDWDSISIDPLDILFTQRLGSNWQEFDLSASHIDLNVLGELLLETQTSSSKIIEIMEGMRPSGNLSSLSIGKNQEGFYVSADLDGFYNDPYTGIPGLKDMHGYLELRGSEGLLHIADSDGFEIYFPKSYKDYLAFDSAQGTVYFNWLAEDKLFVHSDQITAISQLGETKTQFLIEESRSLKQQVPEFHLAIGGSDLDLAQFSTFLPYTMNESAANWLKRAIKTGNLREFGFLFRGGAPKNNHLSRTSQLLFDTEQTEIKFNPAWPQMTEIDSLFVIDDGAVGAQIVTALLGDAKVVNTKIEHAVDVPIEQRTWLVDGKLNGDLSEVINVLANSPLRVKLGPMVDWSYVGKTEMQVNLEIPANSKKQTTVKGNYLTSTLIDNAEIAIAGSPVILENFSGSIEFSSNSGLSADELTATLWQQPLKAKIFKSDSMQRLSFTTSIVPTDLNRFASFPWQQIIFGLIPIKGLLTIDPQSLENPVKLNLTSAMQGVDINLPAPLGKLSEDSRLLDISLYFDQRINRMQGNLGDLLTTDLYFSEGALLKGMLSYDRSVELPEEEIFLVSAYLPTTDLTNWQPLTELISENNKAKRTRRTVFDFEFDSMNFAKMNFEAINAQVEALESGLQIDFTSSLADGVAILPWSNNQPPLIDLTRFELPAKVVEKTSIIDPRQLMAVDLTIDQLFIAENQIGSLSFKLRPEPSGALFNNISGNFFGLRPGFNEAEAPTDFFWGFDGKNHLSKIVGPVGIDNIGDLFNGFGMPQVLDSQSGKLYVDLLWQGKPWSLSKHNLQGDFKVSLQSGNFYNTPGGAGAALKLISLFNFANWLRRLKLDFSDVVGQNLAYDSLEGQLYFDRGIFNLKEPLKMDMPSGRMSMAGDFNLVDETIDAQLVATLPMATNLPWLAGLSGGLPAAVGVYITSKLMEKQVDRLSSISYDLSGPWDEIEVSVNEIFAAELQKSVED